VRFAELLFNPFNGEKMEKEKLKTIHEVMLPFGDSLLKASIWQYQIGEPLPFSVSFSRSYRGKDGKWVVSEYFGRDDLLGLSRIAEVAHGWIVDKSTYRGIYDE
jgi:hypothetical protein